MQAYLRYLALSLCLGVIAVWASENFFWSAPRGDFTAFSFLLTVLVYSLCVSSVLSAVILTGISGWKAVFLGGALLGYVVEGVVVGTMYDAFPAQLIWTPLAWHALVTGLMVFGLSRAGVRWPVWRQIAGSFLAGLFGAAFAQYWPLERGTMPGFLPTAAYIGGLGMLVPLANIGIDRLAGFELPSRRLLLITPVVVTLAWCVKLIIWFNPVMFSWPVVVGLTFWMMHRLGTGASSPHFGSSAPAWRHFLFMVVPIVSVTLSVAGWGAIGGVETNIPVALGTGLCGLLLYLFILWKAVRRKAVTPS